MDENLVIKDRLEAKGIKFVRLLWCDTANVIRAKAFHIDSFDTEAISSIPLASADYGFTALADVVAPNSGLKPVGNVSLQPDWSTLIFPPYAGNHACVMSHVLDRGAPWALDGRALLQKMIAKLYGRYGIRLEVAFQNEFYLLDAVGEEVNITDDTCYASSEALNIHQKFINECADNLIAQGIAVKNVCAGSGPGQLDFSIGHRDPLTAADQQVMFRETARAVARRYNHIASFLPKIFSDAPGSGTPVRFSLWENDLNIVGVDNASGLTQTAEYFIAGVLLHLPALMAITTPTPNSFRRIQPKTWAGAYVVWGHENYEAAIRIPSPDDALYPTNIELRTSDASANPYLVLAALIAAGLDGVKEKYPLDPEMTVDPATLSRAEMNEQAIMPLHTDLWAALEDFRHNDTLKEAMGEDLFRAYLAVKQSELDMLGGVSLDDGVKLLLERY